MRNISILLRLWMMIVVVMMMMTTTITIYILAEYQILNFLVHVLSLHTKEEHELRVFENRVLRRIFGPKREEVAGGWRRLHNEELHNLYDSANVIRVIKWRRMRWMGEVARVEEMRNAYSILVGKPEGKRSLGRPRHRREDNIGIDFREIGWEGVDWMHVAALPPRPVNTA
jgi:hypothetical protein